jgi:hypothetical protein
MNCLECQAWLQERLDGVDLPLTEAVEQHCATCASCREQQAAAWRLLDGLQQLPRPGLPAHFAQVMTARVLQDRRQRQRKMRRRVYVTMALAASVLLLLLAGYAWMPRAPHGNDPDIPPVAADKSKPKNQTPKQDDEHPHAKTQETRNPIASLTERWVDTTRDHATVVLAAANLDGMDMLPAMNDLPPLDPDVREASQDVSQGVRVVTRNARRAFDFFARELPMQEILPQGN